MAKNCKNERIAMTLNYVSLGCMLVLAGAAASHLLKDLFQRTEHHGRSK